MDAVALSILGIVFYFLVPVILTAVCAGKWNHGDKRGAVSVLTAYLVYYLILGGLIGKVLSFVALVNVSRSKEQYFNNTYIVKKRFIESTVGKIRVAVCWVSGAAMIVALFLPFYKLNVGLYSQYFDLSLYDRDMRSLWDILCDEGQAGAIIFVCIGVGLTAVNILYAHKTRFAYLLSDVIAIALTAISMYLCYAHIDFLRTSRVGSRIGSEILSRMFTFSVGFYLMIAALIGLAVSFFLTFVGTQKTENMTL